MKKTHPLLLLPVILLAACASDSGNKKTTATQQTQGARVRGIDEWVQETSKDNGFKKDANGNLIPKSDKRSSFESQGENANFKKDYKKSEYKTGDYTKKSWWGNKAYDSKQYAGNTDGSKFQKASDLQGKGARESGSNAKIPDAYQTDSYATKSAREAGRDPIAKPSNDGIENRREVTVQPEIIDWRELRSLSVDQSKGILGR